MYPSSQPVNTSSPVFIDSIIRLLLWNYNRILQGIFCRLPFLNSLFQFWNNRAHRRVSLHHRSVLQRMALLQTGFRQKQPQSKVHKVSHRKWKCEGCETRWKHKGSHGEPINQIVKCRWNLWRQFSNLNKINNGLRRNFDTRPRKKDRRRRVEKTPRHFNQNA